MTNDIPGSGLVESKANFGVVSFESVLVNGISTAVEENLLNVVVFPKFLGVEQLVNVNAQDGPPISFDCHLFYVAVFTLLFFRR